MRPSEAIAAIGYDPAKDEYCLMYPETWAFSQSKVQPCHILLRFNIGVHNIEQFTGFLDHARSNRDRIGKLWLKTAGLNLITYELNECLNIKYQATVDTITIEMECLYYDQYVKPNPSVKYQTFPSPSDLL